MAGLDQDVTTQPRGSATSPEITPDKLVGFINLKRLTFKVNAVMVSFE